ncbi:MAG TPA: FtsX-like permease family protein, partial [Candidatus Baltobacteraceae bacterium]|nr:FtsX-like permease family protein [Candidatus Baltobacteraceae bacterium]
TMTEIQHILRRQHRIPQGRPDDFEINNQADFLSAFQETTQVFGLLLAGIATVSLLVGGIGIMNIMLVSVTERTREIGIRKSIGASPGDISLQFLIEAVLLSVFGGLLGTILGVVIVNFGKGIIAQSVGAAPVPWVLVISVAAGFSMLVGIVFGSLPAARAAALDPVEALRS